MAHKQPAVCAAQHCMTFQLDYSKQSDLDDSVGYWFVQPRRRDSCRVFYSCETKLRGWVPAPVYALLIKAALKQTTTWVNVEALREWQLEQVRMGSKKPCGWRRMVGTPTANDRTRRLNKSGEPPASPSPFASGMTVAGGRLSYRLSSLGHFAIYACALSSAPPSHRSRCLQERERNRGELFRMREEVRRALEDALERSPLGKLQLPKWKNSLAQTRLTGRDSAAGSIRSGRFGRSLAVSAIRRPMSFRAALPPLRKQTKRAVWLSAATQ